MKMSDIIKNIVSSTEKNNIIISCNGMISRELYEAKDRERNFYVQGSMGAALSLGIGIAMNTEENVIVLLGDGNALMNLSDLALAEYLCLPNLHVYVLDNGEHSSTGCQPTISKSVNFEELNQSCVRLHVDTGKGTAPRIPLTCKEISNRFIKGVKKNY